MEEKPLSSVGGEGQDGEVATRLIDVRFEPGEENMISAAKLPGGEEQVRQAAGGCRVGLLSAAVSGRQDKAREGWVGLKVSRYLGTWGRPLDRTVVG